MIRKTFEKTLMDESVGILSENELKPSKDIDFND